MQICVDKYNSYGTRVVRVHSVPKIYHIKFGTTKQGYIYDECEIIIYIGRIAMYVRDEPLAGADSAWKYVDNGNYPVDIMYLMTKAEYFNGPAVLQELGETAKRIISLAKKIIELLNT